MYGYVHIMYHCMYISLYVHMYGYVHIMYHCMYISLYVHMYGYVHIMYHCMYISFVVIYIYIFFSSDKTADGYEIQLQVNTAKVAFSVILLKMTALIIPWIVEHRELDRKRARPAILNVWRFGKPLKYSGLRAASEVPRSASRNSTALLYPYHGKFYG